MTRLMSGLRVARSRKASVPEARRRDLRTSLSSESTRSAFLIETCRRSAPTGLTTKSTAPARIALTTASIEPCAVWTIDRRLDAAFAHLASTPMPSRSGITKSRTTRSMRAPSAPAVAIEPARRPPPRAARSRIGAAWPREAGAGRDRRRRSEWWIRHLKMLPSRGVSFRARSAQRTVKRLLRHLSEPAEALSRLRVDPRGSCRRYVGAAPPRPAHCIEPADCRTLRFRMSRARIAAASGGSVGPTLARLPEWNLRRPLSRRWIARRSETTSRGRKPNAKLSREAYRGTLDALARGEGDCDARRGGCSATRRSRTCSAA